MLCSVPGQPHHSTLPRLKHRFSYADELNIGRNRKTSSGKCGLLDERKILLNAHPYSHSCMYMYTYPALSNRAGNRCGSQQNIVFFFGATCRSQLPPHGKFFMEMSSHPREQVVRRFLCARSDLCSLWRPFQHDYARGLAASQSYGRCRRGECPPVNLCYSRVY